MFSLSSAIYSTVEIVLSLSVTVWDNHPVQDGTFCVFKEPQVLRQISRAKLSNSEVSKLYSTLLVSLSRLGSTFQLEKQGLTAVLTGFTDLSFDLRVGSVSVMMDCLSGLSTSCMTKP